MKEPVLSLKERAARAHEHERADHGGLPAESRTAPAAAAQLHGEPLGDGRVRLVDEAGRCWGIAAAPDLAARTQRFFQ